MPTSEQLEGFAKYDGIAALNGASQMRCWHEAERA
jgi:hypothetical protein